MQNAEHPKSPFNATCATCPFWIKDVAKKCYDSPQGYIAVEAISLANLPPGMKLLGTGQVDVAPCARDPQWTLTATYHWCWQHGELELEHRQRVSLSLMRDFKK